jgi:hypothetical protein
MTIPVFSKSDFSILPGSLNRSFILEMKRKQFPPDFKYIGKNNPSFTSGDNMLLESNGRLDKPTISTK